MEGLLYCVLLLCRSCGHVQAAGADPQLHAGVQLQHGQTDQLCGPRLRRRRTRHPSPARWIPPQIRTHSLRGCKHYLSVYLSISLSVLVLLLVFFRKIQS